MMKKHIFKSFVLCLFSLLLISSVVADEHKDARALSKSFNSVASKAFPSVVVIENLQSQKMMHRLPPEFEFFFGVPKDHQFRNQKNKGPMVVGRGSGMIIREDGIIVTNMHVIDKAEFLRVKLKDGTVFDNQVDKDAVKLIGVDESSDIAVLQISAKNLPVLEFANSDETYVGEWAIAIGAPFNYDYTLTVGVISQVGRHNVFRDRFFESYIQTDASINPGNSGGPLLNIDGQVIGVNNFIATGGGAASSAGIGFAITGNLVKRVVDDILNTGSVKRPWLGISMADLNSIERKSYGIEKGVLIKEVLKGQPAEKAGLQSGDVISQIAGKDVNSAYEVQQMVLTHKPGDVIHVSVKRGSKNLEFKIKAVVRGGDSTLVESSVIPRLGFSLSETDKGLLVDMVEEGSDAYAKGIRAGSLLLEINRNAVASINDVNEILKEIKGNALMLKLSYKGKVFIEFIRY